MPLIGISLTDGHVKMFTTSGRQATTWRQIGDITTKPSSTAQVSGNQPGITSPISPVASWVFTVYIYIIQDTIIPRLTTQSSHRLIKHSTAVWPRISVMIWWTQDTIWWEQMGDLIIFWSLYSSFYTLLSSPDWWEVGESKCREYHPLIIITIASYKINLLSPSPNSNNNNTYIHIIKPGFKLHHWQAQFRLISLNAGDQGAIRSVFTP